MKMPKILATPKKHGKIKATPFLNNFKGSDAESEVRILIKILILKLSNLITLFVHNCIDMIDSLDHKVVMHVANLQNPVL